MIEPALAVLARSGLLRAPLVAMFALSVSGASGCKIEKPQTDGVQAVRYGDDRVHRVTVPEHGGAPLATSDRRLPADERAPFAHGGRVTGMVYSPDGALLITSSSDTGVRVFQAATGQLQRALRESLWSANAVAISPDGRVVASGGRSHLYLWDVASGELVNKAKGTLWDYLHGVAFTPDGNAVITGSGSMDPFGDHRMQRFGSSGGRPMTSYASRPRRLPGAPMHEDRAQVQAVLATQSQVAGLYSDGTLRLFAHEGGEPTVLQVHEDIDRADAAIAAYRDGFLTTGREPALAYTALTDGAAAAPRTVVDEGTGLAVAVHPDGSRAALGGIGKVDIVDLATGAVQATARTRARQDNQVGALALAPDGATVAFADGRRLSLARTDDGQLVDPGGEGPSDPVEHLGWTADNAMVVAGSRNELHAWNAADSTLAWSVGFEGDIAGLAVASEQVQVLAGGVLHALPLTPAPSGTRARADAPDGAASLAQLAFPEGSRHFLVTGTSSGPLRLTRLQGPELGVSTLAPPRDGEGYQRVRCLGVAASGAAVIAGFDDLVRIWPTDGGPVADLPVRSVKQCALAPDGRRAALHAGYGNRASVRIVAVTARDLDSDAVVIPTVYPVGALGFSPDGARLAVAYDRHASYRWQVGEALLAVFDAATGKRTLSVRVHGALRALAFSPDGTQLAAAGEGGRVHLVDLGKRRRR